MHKPTEMTWQNLNSLHLSYYKCYYDTNGHCYLETLVILNQASEALVDPGFPVGGCGPIMGGMDLQRGHFSLKMYAKTKELGPVGGRARPLDPPMYSFIF